MTNTQYKWISQALSVFVKVGGKVTVTPPDENQPGRLEVLLEGYDPPPAAAPGEPSLVVQYLIDRIFEQTGVDVSEDEHTLKHLDAIVEKSLRGGIAPTYTVPFSVDTENGKATHTLTIDSRDPNLRELLDR